MATLYGITDDAITDFFERVKEKSPNEDIGDLVHEVADSHVPIYTRELLEVASDSLSIVCEEPELWPAFDGRPTPMNIIAANIYEYLTEKLREKIQEREELLSD